MAPAEPADSVDITLLSTINRDYWSPFEVLAWSLLRAKLATTTVEWHLVTDEELAPWTAWLQRLQSRQGGDRVSFVLHRLADLAAVRLPLRGRARHIMYARILVPARLANRCPRLLYLDADMLVLRPIEELWATPLGEKVCACCQDLVVPTVASPMGIRAHRSLGLAPDAPYFNAGVMLIDTAKWQAASAGQRALAYLARHARVNLFDQEALNAALVGHWQPLSCRWNMIASVAGRRFFHPTPGQREDYAASLPAPGIVHYAGTLKPWQNPLLRGRYYDLYREAVTATRPEHIGAPSFKHRALAAYDRWARDWVYALEHALWQARGGF